MALAGLLDRQRKSQRSRLITATILLLLLGGVAFFFAVIWSGIAAENAQWNVSCLPWPCWPA